MNENDKSNPFFDSYKLDKDKHIFEVPVDQRPLTPERTPSAFDPMGQIYLEGRAYRNFAGGRIPWWVLLSGWVIFGGQVLLILATAIASKSFALLPPLAFAGICLLFVYRGTVAKISSTKNRRK